MSEQSSSKTQRAELHRTPRQLLWLHMSEEHGVILLESEIDEIERLAKAIPAVEPTAGELNVAPIARIEVIGGEISQTELYAPGLPDGAHELFPVPLNPNGELRPFLRDFDAPAPIVAAR